MKRRKSDLKEFYLDLYTDEHVPFCIKRRDGALLLMNNDFRTYSFWKTAGGELWINDFDAHAKYSYRRLFADFRIEEGDFVVESWAPIPNLFNNPEKYFTEECQIIVNYRPEILNRMKILTPTSLGELYDKISILEIKIANIKDPVKLANVIKEYKELKVIGDANPIDHDLYEKLKWINEDLWTIEDEIRTREKNKDFGEKFIELARAVYVTNDKRSEAKKEINLIYGSDLIEEKSYEKY